MCVRDKTLFRLHLEINYQDELVAGLPAPSDPEVASQPPPLPAPPCEGSLDFPPGCRGHSSASVGLGCRGLLGRSLNLLQFRRYTFDFYST